jgi:hypothetical protein
MKIYFTGPCGERIEPRTCFLLRRDECGGLWYKVGKHLLSHFHLVYRGDGLEESQEIYFRSAYNLIEDTQFLLQAPNPEEAMHPVDRRIVVVAKRNPFMYKLSATDPDYERVPSGGEAIITTGSIVSFCGLEFAFHAERPRPKLSLGNPKKL